MCIGRFFRLTHSRGSCPEWWVLYDLFGCFPRFESTDFYKEHPKPHLLWWPRYGPVILCSMCELRWSIIIDYVWTNVSSFAHSALGNLNFPTEQSQAALPLSKSVAPSQRYLWSQHIKPLASEEAADRHINIMNIGHFICARSRQVVTETLVV